MKKIILIAGLLLSGLTQAQVVYVEGNDDTEITDGYVYETSELGLEGESKLKIVANNLTEETIYVQLKMNSMVNADGNDEFIQFCFGNQCYFGVEPNDVVPSVIAQAAIAAGSHNVTTDHFANAYPGDVVGQPIEYNMSLIQVDAAGAFIANLVTFTYKYTPLAGTNDLTGLANIGISIKNTVVKNQLMVDAQQNAKLELFNINGQVVKSAAIASGSQSVDLSGVSAAVYIARFTNEENKTSQIRIVKN